MSSIDKKAVTAATDDVEKGESAAVVVPVGESDMDLVSSKSRPSSSSSLAAAAADQTKEIPEEDVRQKEGFLNDVIATEANTDDVTKDNATEDDITQVVTEGLLHDPNNIPAAEADTTHTADEGLLREANNIPTIPATCRSTCISDADASMGPSWGQNDHVEKNDSQKKKVLRYLRRKEVVFCMLGGVMFFAGIILIVVAVATVNSGCGVQYESGDGSSQTEWSNSVEKSYSEGNPSNATIAINLAEGRPAVQSSTEWAKDGSLYNASLATDGNHGHSLSKDGCAQTEMEHQPHWYVDLGKAEHVKRVVIVGGGCCVGELHNFEVRVGQSREISDNELCREHIGTALKLTVTMWCDRPVYGRYVSIEVFGDEARTNNRLTLCDVMVYRG